MSFREWLFGPVNWKLTILMRKVDKLATREEVADARFGELLGLVKEAHVAYQHEIDALKAELANADANAQARVDEALAADSEHDAEKKEAGNAALEELLSRGEEEEPPTEEEPEPPVDEEPAPVDPTTPEEDPNRPEV